MDSHPIRFGRANSPAVDKTRIKGLQPQWLDNHGYHIKIVRRPATRGPRNRTGPLPHLAAKPLRPGGARRLAKLGGNIRVATRAKAYAVIENGKIETVVTDPGSVYKTPLNDESARDEEDSAQGNASIRHGIRQEWSDEFRRGCGTSHQPVTAARREESGSRRWGCSPSGYG
jgi:hypothetical protein